MKNGPARAAFWTEFVRTRCQYPAPDLLAAQLDHAAITEFCDCGCNSFGLSIAPGSDVRPLLPPKKDVVPGRHGAIFTADFRLADGKTLEIIIFAGDDGNLDYIEVDCCANSTPVPDDVAVDGPPFHVHASKTLFR